MSLSSSSEGIQLLSFFFFPEAVLFCFEDTLLAVLVVLALLVGVLVVLVVLVGVLVVLELLVAMRGVVLVLATNQHPGSVTQYPNYSIIIVYIRMSIVSY